MRVWPHTIFAWALGGVRHLSFAAPLKQLYWWACVAVTGVTLQKEDCDLLSEAKAHIIITNITSKKTYFPGQIPSSIMLSI